MKYSYKPQGICAQNIQFDINEDVITNVSFTGGCDGNHKGIISLVEGMKVSEISKKLSGITCGFRPTSCPDQLAKAVVEAYENSKNL